MNQATFWIILRAIGSMVAGGARGGRVALTVLWPGRLYSLAASEVMNRLLWCGLQSAAQRDPDSPRAGRIRGLGQSMDRTGVPAPRAPPWELRRPAETPAPP
jgi:hypothetical protein